MNSNQNGSTTTVTLIAVAVMAMLVVGLWQSGIFDTEELTNNVGTESVTNPQTVDELESTTSDRVGAALVESTREEAELAAVGDFKGTGTATNVSDEEGMTFHEVVARLSNPPEGKFYEGWIVGPSVISTGALESEGGVEWSLIYSTDDDISKHDDVVITLETEANGLDNIPEDHVLEGSF